MCIAMQIIKNQQLNMRKIADSGQVFRFNKSGEGRWELIASNRLLNIEQINIRNYEEGYRLSCSAQEFKNYWEHYFDLEADYNKYMESIPPDDEFLSSAARYSKGMRILYQDKWEMLISFIISQRKSIPAIKTSIEKLCRNFGVHIESEKYAFPTPEAIADADISILESCSLGYRSKYVYEAARRVASGECDLDSYSQLNDEELLAALMGFKGVGVKVANCVALFAYHRINAFPVDVWIDRLIKEHYDGKFDVALYKGYAGIIQQYMFFYGREMANVRLK